MKNLEKLECKGYCWLNICGYMKPYEIICRKCNGTKEDVDNINKAFQNDNNKKIILDKYNFNDEELKILNELWF